MEIRNHYLALKPILNRTLFALDDTEHHFQNHEKLIFDNVFINYHSRFLKEQDEDKHELLMMNLLEYFEEANLQNRQDIVRVILENELITETIIFMSSLDKGKAINSEENVQAFLLSLQKFEADRIVNPQFILFFLLYFNNLEHVNPYNFTDCEVSKSEYDILISRYLQLQTDFKFV